MDIRGKVAAITGAGRGIGRSTALEFAGEGCNVSLIARTQREIDEVSEEARSKGVDTLAVSGDVGSSTDVKKFMEETVSKFGRIDFLINNAGIAFSKPLVDTGEAEWDRLIDTNLKGVFLCCKEALPHMDTGVIVNVSSGAGKHGFANLSAYCASKFGVIGLTESLAKETNVKVVAVCPGAVATGMQDDIYGENTNVPKASMLSPEKVARKIVILCDPNSRHKTGSCINI